MTTHHATTYLTLRLRRHLGYAVVISCLAVLAGYNGVLPVFRSHLMDYLAIGDAGFGLLFSIGSISSLLSVLCGGTLIDRWGPRRVIRLGLTGVGAAMFIVALGGVHFWAFVLAMTVAGVFSAPLFIAITAYLARLFPRHQRRIISLNLASSSLGGMLFPLVAEGLLTLERQSIHLTFSQVLHLPFFLVGALLLGASLLYRPTAVSRPPAARAGGPWWHWRDLALPPRTLVLAGLIALHGMADATLYLWMSRFLESRSFGVALLAPGIVLSGYALAYLLSRVIMASLPDHVGRRAFLVLPGLLGGSLVIAGLLSRQYLLTAGGYLLGAFCWSFEYPTMVSSILRHHRRQFGAVMAVSGVLTSLLSFAMMNGMGWLIAYLGEARMWQVMCLPAGAFLLVGLGGLAWWWRFERQHGKIAITQVSHAMQPVDDVSR